MHYSKRVKLWVVERADQIELFYLPSSGFSTAEWNACEYTRSLSEGDAMRLTNNFRAMSLTKNLGMLLLGIWLILSGLILLLHLSFAGLGTLMAILAIAAGAFILLGR